MRIGLDKNHPLGGALTGQIRQLLGTHGALLLDTLRMIHDVRDDSSYVRVDIRVLLLHRTCSNLGLTILAIRSFHRIDDPRGKGRCQFFFNLVSSTRKEMRVLLLELVLLRLLRRFPRLLLRLLGRWCCRCRFRYGVLRLIKPTLFGCPRRERIILDGMKQLGEF